MCGVVGQYVLDPVQPDENSLSKMVSSLDHRGPDDRGIWCAKHIGLGHTRLAIRDLSSAGHQPISINSGEIASSYNGEIYNDEELRAQLQSDYRSKLTGHCDAETIPWAYLQWGVDAFQKLEGMYAIALWDARANCLYLARDPIGIKPLYYTSGPKGVAFASEVKALAAVQKLEVEPSGLHTFLAIGQSGPEKTWFKNVSQVPPGTILRFDNFGMKSIPIWSPTRCSTTTDASSALSEFSGLWHKTVQRHLVSDVPIALLQSGGIDSSLISLALAGSPGITAYTASFDDATYDETSLAVRLCESAKLDHQIIPVSKTEDPVKTFRDIVWHSDGQCGDTGIVPFWQLCKAISSHTKVALTGDGGDEFFAGYETYSASRLVSHMPAILASKTGIWATAASLSRRFNHSYDRLPLTDIATRFFSGLATSGTQAHVEWRRLLYERHIKELYGPELTSFVDVDPLADYKNALGDANDLDACLLADQKFHIHSILRKADYCSMAHGLELRVPLLDQNVMDFSARCAATVLWDGGKYKKTLLRSAAQNLGCPNDLLQESKKGFNAPIASMLVGELRPQAELVFSQDVDRMASFINPQSVRSLWKAHHGGKANHAYVLWPLLIFGTALELLKVE